MKRALLLTCVLCLLLTGCGAAQEPTDTPTTTSATETTKPTTPTSTSPSIPEGFITEEAALQIAYDYWNFTPGDTISVGTGDPDDAKGAGAVHIETYPTTDAPYYEAVYSWYVPESGHRSVLDHVWIDAVTGKTSTSLPS